MDTSLDQFRKALWQLGPVDSPVLTAAFDLRPASGAILPAADVVLDKTLDYEQTQDEVKRRADLASLQRDSDALRELVDEAVREGAHGLYYVGSAAAGIQLALTTPLPFRFVVRTGDRPYLFELERYRFLYERPVTLVQVELPTVRIVRTVFGGLVLEQDVKTNKRAVTHVHGRTPRDDSVFVAGTFHGGHGKNRVEARVEAHRLMFAREAADEITRAVGDDDILVVAGPVEPRSGVINQLPQRLREHIIDASAPQEELTQREAREFAATLAARQQLADTDAFVRELVDGLPERRALGPEAARQSIAEGRVDTLVFHEEAAGYFGTAEDTRHRAGRLDADTADGLLRDGLGQGANVRFCREDALLEQYDGVAARLRW